MSSTRLDARYRPVRPAPAATLREFRAFLSRGARWAGQTGASAANAPSGGAVLVIPTLLRSDRQTRDLRHWLAGEGYAPFGWGLGRNVGPTPELMAGADARLLALAAAHGPVSLIGLSMGGIFARWLAARHPALVRQVITVCSPFRAPLDSFFLPLRSVQRVWRLPNLHELALQLERPLPVPGVCLYSKRDGIVAWQSCCEVERPEECIAVDTAHVEIAMNPNVRAVVLEQLRRFTPHPQP